LGAVRQDQTVYLSLAADQPWSGRVRFDKPRHKLNLRLPVDYPRINQFAEWFTTEADSRYVLREVATGRERSVSGREMQAGVLVELQPGIELRWRIQ
jgi:hypothetical protein